jgi:hypothetical protein
VAIIVSTAYCSLEEALRERRLLRAAKISFLLALPALAIENPIFMRS